MVVNSHLSPSQNFVETKEKTENFRVLYPEGSKTAVIAGAKRLDILFDIFTFIKFLITPV